MSAPPPVPTSSNPSPSNHTSMYVAGGVVLLLVVGLGLYFSLRKKSPTASPTTGTKKSSSATATSTPAAAAECPACPTCPAPGPWQCVTGVTVPVRKNAKGDVECMSQDMKHCLWKSTKADCEELMNNPPEVVEPLACGTQHKSVYGSTGYNDPDHWCAIAEAQLS